MHQMLLERCPTQAWRNGGGSTRELLAWPTPAAWQLRVSVARIDRDGPFSAYPGVQRWFVVLQGAGVRLHWPQAVQNATRGSGVLVFDGSQAPGCTLIDGPTLDLNLMLQGGTGALLSAQPGQAWSSTAVLRGLFTFSTALLQRAGATLPLPPGTLAWCDNSNAEPWTAQADNEPLRAWWLHFQPSPS
jgi:uncharacterized protein